KEYFKHTQIILNTDITDVNELATAKDILDNSSESVNSIAFNANQNDIINFNSIESKQYDLAKRHIIEQYNKITDAFNIKGKDVSIVLLNWDILKGNTCITNGDNFIYCIYL